MTTQAVSMRGVFDDIGYAPHEVQVRIHNAQKRARWRAVCAGRRTGKSTLGGHEFTVDAIQSYYLRDQLDRHTRRWEQWVVGPEYSDAEKEFRVIYGDLERLGIPFDKPGTYYDAVGGNMHISLWDGRFQVHGKSAKYPDTLVGEGVRRVIMAEAAKLKPSVWYKNVRPTLADLKGDGLFTSTPEGKNWFYDLWTNGVNDETGEYWSIRMPSWSNPFVYPLGRNDPEIVSMARGLPTEKFNQEIGAEFSDFVGAVFKDWDEVLHVGDFAYNPRLPVYVCVDWGYTNPTVVLFVQVDIFNNVYVIGEYYEAGRTADEVASDVRNHHKLGPFANSARVVYGDPASPGDTATLGRILRLSPRSGTGGELNDRLNLIRKWLKVDATGEPMFHVDRSCKHLIYEMGEYRYPDESADKEKRNPQEKPTKKNDHAPEALGRFFISHFGRTMISNHVRQSSAIVKR